MKIKTPDNEIIDTDLLSDMDAIVMEKNKEIFDFFKKHNISFKLTTVMHGKFAGGAQYSRSESDTKQLVAEINIWLGKISAGKLKVCESA